MIKLRHLILVVFVLATISLPLFVSNFSTNAQAASTGNIIQDVNTDKAMYSPGQTVTIYADLKNNTGATLTNGSVTLYFKHLTTEVSSPSTRYFTLSPGSTTTLVWSWTPPNTDFQGYLVEALAKDSSDNVIDNMNVGVDVSSSWTKFPRYGYLSYYPSQSSDTSYNTIWQLKNYHINALQYYDWQWKHHIPLAGTVNNPASNWVDIANRATYRQTILNMINAGHGYNIAAMNYNLVYGAYNGYGEDGSGVNYQWSAYTDSSHTAQDYLSFSEGWACTALYLFNPGNTSWQNYLISRENDVFAAYPFDGWHADQLGDGGTRYDYNGNVINMTLGFKNLLNAAKTGTGKKIIFNNVGDYGQEDVADSNVDAMYSELWHGDYNIVRDSIETGISLSGGKAKIIAGYMNSGYSGQFSSENPGYFNAPGVLLMDAVTFASGGSRIELGDDTRMLCSAYFPNRNLIMSDTMKRQMRNYYDFLVAYENLLRGDIENISNTVSLTGISSSTLAEAGKVWTFTKTGGGNDIIHLINLLDQSTIDWRDYDGNYPIPTTRTDIEVKYYYGSGTINSVAMASPDYENGKSFLLSYTSDSDDKGSYITFTVPSLQYWDMIYINKSDGPGQQIAITNPGFETGDLTGWTEWHPSGQSASYVVDSADVHSGNHKCYFWSASPYQQSIHKLQTGLENGSYTVKAWVKQNKGYPLKCRMEVANYGGPAVDVNIPHNESYVQYAATVNVTNGQLDIGFYIYSRNILSLLTGYTDIQIDDVELWKN